ncbi:MAG: hypothetical protein JXB10_07380 [Pirellulales bacterium]|nr:hypothetical protein [Pirellulales bacterium]
MISPLLILPIFYLAANPSAVPVALEFKDAETCQGRPAVQYRAIEFHDAPVRPLGEGQKFPAGAKYGLLPVGPKPETGLMIVWIPKAAGGAELWLDADGDDKLSENERHVLSGKQLELPAAITVQTEPEKKQVRRTLLLRRSALGDGLRCAVRGYAQGRLRLGEKEFDVVLLDGNADGCLDTVGHDRVWIDLSADGRYDLLTEQYPLGKPITQDGQVYVVRSDPLAGAVVVNLRSVGEGKLRLVLAGKPDSSAEVAAELVSDIGEFLSMDKMDEFVPVPYGEYRFARLQLEVPDADGKTWSYYFYAEEPRNHPAPLDKETTLTLLDRCVVNVQMSTEGKKIKPGEEFQVRPQVLADGCLSLSSCDTKKKGESRGTDVEAEVTVIAPDGKVVHRSSSGFA